eukprot:1156298-Pelagomonas_calceolata.AAC.3
MAALSPYPPPNPSPFPTPHHHRACYGVLRYVMESGAKGCEVIVSGKLRAARAKAMKFKDGYMVSSGEPTRTYIDSAVRHVLLRQGVLGIKSITHQKGAGCMHGLPTQEQSYHAIDVRAATVIYGGACCKRKPDPVVFPTYMLRFTPTEITFGTDSTSAQAPIQVHGVVTGAKEKNKRLRGQTWPNDIF